METARIGIARWNTPGQAEENATANELQTFSFIWR
jgi:hypothetical protein